MGKFRVFSLKHRRRYFYYFVLIFTSFLLFTQYQNCSSGGGEGLVIGGSSGGGGGGPNLPDCGANWPMMGTFSCDGSQNQTQQICGCRPPLYSDPMAWLDQGGGCYIHSTGKGCANFTYNRVSCDGTNCIYTINYTINGLGAAKKSMIIVRSNPPGLFGCNTNNQGSSNTGNWVPMPPAAPLTFDVYSLTDNEAANDCAQGFASVGQMGYPAGRLVLQGGQ